MNSHNTRRRFMRVTLASAAALGLSRMGTAAASAAPVLSSQRLSDTLLLVRGAGGTVVVARDTAGLLLIDGGDAARGAGALRLAQRELGALKVQTLINTHWHPDHTGLNEMLGRAGCKIIAHENTRLWLSTDVRPTPDAAPIRRLSPMARPNATVYTQGTLSLSDETVTYGYLSQAHTDGDLYVKFAKANVLVTGGVVAGNGWPTADWVTGGWITGTVAGYKTLLEQCDDSTRVVSAYGSTLLNKAGLVAEQAMLATLADQLTKMLRKGFAPADMLAAAPAKDYEATMGDATTFLTESFKSLWPRMAPDA